MSGSGIGHQVVDGTAAFDILAASWDSVALRRTNVAPPGSVAQHTARSRAGPTRTERSEVMPVATEWSTELMCRPALQHLDSGAPLVLDFDGKRRHRNRELTLTEARLWVARGRTRIVIVADDNCESGVSMRQVAFSLAPDEAMRFLEDHAHDIGLESTVARPGEAVRDGRLFVFGKRSGSEDTRLVVVVFGYC